MTITIDMPQEEFVHRAVRYAEEAVSNCYTLPDVEWPTLLFGNVVRYALGLIDWQHPDPKALMSHMIIEVRTLITDGKLPGFIESNSDVLNDDGCVRDIIELLTRGLPPVATIATILADEVARDMMRAIEALFEETTGTDIAMYNKEAIVFVG